MAEHVLVAIAAIVAIGIGAQWLAWRFHLPAILLLLIAGFIAGPATGLLDPGELFGDLLVPVVEASVAIILFEGGLSLNWREVKGVRHVVVRLVTIGAAVTLVIGMLGAHYVLAFDLGLALLVGAIMIVTGPTVIGPLIRNVRPKGKVGPILRWEGILIDPIGAVLAVLVLEAVILGEPGEEVSSIIVGVLRTGAFGTGVGLLAAAVMVVVLKRYLIPDFLHNAVSLALVIGAFTVADEVVAESGLVAVTVMGMALANQRITTVRHIIEFKETLRTLLISGLFVVLAADIELSGMSELGFAALTFLGLLLVSRFVSVYVSVIGSSLQRAERFFLSAVAPRGIVAAAVSSVFAFRLEEAGVRDAELLAPLTFSVIVGTIVIYGSSANWIAKRLDLADTSPQGVLIVGAHPLAREIATVLTTEDLRVMLVDTDYGNVAAARMKGLSVAWRSILAEEVGHQIEFEGIGRLLALTSNDELNSLAVQHYLHLFGRAEVYQLPPMTKGDATRAQPLAMHQTGRLLFGKDVTYDELLARIERGATIKKTNITEEFGFEDFRERYGETAIPLFLVTQQKKLSVFTSDGKPVAKPGDKLVALIEPDGATSERAEAERAPADVSG